MKHKRTHEKRSIEKSGCDGHSENVHGIDETETNEGSFAKHNSKPTNQVDCREDQGSISCPLCPKKFIEKGACDQHLEVHGVYETGDFCTICSKYFSDERSLATHFKKVHEILAGNDTSDDSTKKACS